MQQREAAFAAIVRCVVLRARNSFGHDFVLAAHAADIELIERGWLLRGVQLGDFIKAGVPGLG
ncbi:hypothetical protein, partial [Pseudomonas sp.]|uniref:hypothetical protein n=2 Tax=Pseudomonas TaxID=286 RepID=UPI0032DB4F39